jgi:hypothetical protein
MSQTRSTQPPSTGRNVRKILLANLVALTVTMSGSAQPPAGADPNSEIAKWFKTLKNDQGLPCCDISDCRRVEARLMNGYYEVLIDQQWARVPDRAVRTVENPMGQYIACYIYYEGTREFPPHFYCFVPISLALSMDPSESPAQHARV